MKLKSFTSPFWKKKKKDIYILPAVRANNRYLSATSWQTWFASCKTALSTWISLNQLLSLNTNCNDFTTVEQQRGNDMIAFHWMRPELRKSHNIFIMPRWKIFLFFHNQVAVKVFLQLWSVVCISQLVLITLSVHSLWVTWLI